VTKTQVREKEWLEQVRHVHTLLEDRLIKGDFYGVGGRRCILAMSVVPALQPKKPLTLREPELLTAGSGLRSIGAESTGEFISRTHTLANASPLVGGERIHAVEITMQGTILTAYHWLWHTDADRKSDEIIGVVIRHYERVFGLATYHYVALLKSLLVDGPYAITFSLLHSRNTRLLPHGDHRDLLLERMNRGLTIEDNIRLDPIQIPAEFVAGNVQEIMPLLRPAIDQFWRGYGFIYGAESYDKQSGKYLWELR
jgi:hypothetical protein